MQRHAAQLVLLLYGEADHVDAAPGKGLHAEGGREGQNPADFQRRRQVGVDDHVQPDFLLQKVGLAAVFRVPDPGHRVLGPQLLGNQAAHQVGLVQVGDGDDQVGAARPGPHQHRDAGGVAHHAHHVQGVLRPGQRLGAPVHHGDVVSLAGELLGDGVAHLAVAYDDNFHVASSPFRATCTLRCCKTAASSAPRITTTADMYSHSSTTTMAAMEPYSTA